MERSSISASRIYSVAVIIRVFHTRDGGSTLPGFSGVESKAMLNMRERVVASVFAAGSIDPKGCYSMLPPFFLQQHL